MQADRAGAPSRPSRNDLIINPADSPTAPQRTSYRTRSISHRSAPRSARHFARGVPGGGGRSVS
ncbi:hypothetical protein GCM10009736_78740 [Actinomadura bangladeshensis]